MRDVQVGDIVLFWLWDERFEPALVVEITDGRYRLRPLRISTGAFFTAPSVVPCIMGFAGPVPLENLDALSDG